MKLTPISWRTQYEIDRESKYLVRVGTTVFVASPFAHQGELWFDCPKDRICYNFKDVAELYLIELI